jgi:hypothetical protein
VNVSLNWTKKTACASFDKTGRLIYLAETLGNGQKRAVVKASVEEMEITLQSRLVVTK